MVDMETSSGAASVKGFKLFGATIEMEATQGKEDTKKGDQPHEKRPRKALPCPRCKSLDTKFCYFNNYNVNQPRHFCKGCQRYWTAGGSLRNIPFRAGRRKTRPAETIGFSNNCMLEASQVKELDLEGVLLEQWHVSTSVTSSRPNGSC